MLAGLCADLPSQAVRSPRRCRRVPARTAACPCAVRRSRPAALSRLPGRCRSAAANIRRSHGPISRLERRRPSGGLQDLPHQLQADLGADRTHRRLARRWAARCAIPAAPPEPPTSSDSAGAGVFRGEFPAVAEFRGSARTKALSPAITSRSSTARGRGPTSTPCRSIAGHPTCSSAASSRTRRAAEQGRGVSQDRPPQARALLRSRRDRGRRHRRPWPRNLLAQEPDRFAVRADPGLGAGPSRGRLDHPHQLRCA